MKDPTSYVARSNIMWASTQALNGWIAQGVQQDWATHYVGHELTAYLGMDHGRTLACVQPRVLRFNFESKKGKLAQMGRRVFDLEGSDEEVAILREVMKKWRTRRLMRLWISMRRIFMFLLTFLHMRTQKIVAG